VRLLEYQAKELFKEYGIRVPDSIASKDIESGRKEDRIDILPHSLHVWYEFTDKVTEFCDWLLENVYLIRDIQSEKNNV